MGVDRIPDLVQRLYAVVRELEESFPGRRFTPDGHLVGSIGEVVAASRYGLTLLTASEPNHDAVDALGRLVQIKATQGSSVALRASPDHLIVLRLDPTGSAEEIYNGPGDVVWCNCGKMQANGQRPIRLTTLRRLQGAIPANQRIAAGSVGAS